MQGVRIAFSGKMQVGKTTSAEYLVRKYGFVKLSFAGKLKEIAKDLWSEQFECNQKPRKLLQDLGMKMREIDQDVWVNYVLRIVHILPKDSNIVIDDLRFMNEYKALKNEGFFIVRIIRDVPPSPFDNHPSEKEVEQMPYDVLLLNTGTLDRLYEKLDKIMEMLNKNERK